MFVIYDVSKYKVIFYQASLKNIGYEHRSISTMTSPLMKKIYAFEKTWLYKYTFFRGRGGGDICRNNDGYYCGVDQFLEFTIIKVQKYLIYNGINKIYTKFILHIKEPLSFEKICRCFNYQICRGWGSIIKYVEDDGPIIIDLEYKGSIIEYVKDNIISMVNHTYKMFNVNCSESGQEL